LERTFELKVLQTPIKAYEVQPIASPNDSQLNLRKKWLALN